MPREWRVLADGERCLLKEADGELDDYPWRVKRVGTDADIWLAFPSGVRHADELLVELVG